MALIWTDEKSPLPAIQKKWTDGGELTEEELQIIHENHEQNEDVRIRETCRTLIAAMNRNFEGEPHVQRLLRLRNTSLLQAKIRRLKPNGTLG